MPVITSPSLLIIALPSVDRDNGAATHPEPFAQLGIRSGKPVCHSEKNDSSSNRDTLNRHSASARVVNGSGEGDRHKRIILAKGDFVGLC